MENMRRLLGNPSFLPPSNHGVLKSLLENPMTLPLPHGGFVKEKEKSLEEERSAPQSAFLGPTLWDKTLPYDGDSFQLEYMDLEEFLSENGIPATPSLCPSTATPALCPATPSLCPPPQHHHQQGQSQAGGHPAPILTRASLTPSPAAMDFSDLAAASSLHASMGPQHGLHSPVAAALSSARGSPSPVDPESIQVSSGYEPDPADLALSSVPGQEMFDPRKRKFSAEELRPQPMIKKARKVLMPDDMKDDRYWARRRKNNMAAKRSRDARRLKENQIAIRAGFLEKENGALRQEVVELRKELGRAKSALAKHQARHGPL